MNRFSKPLVQIACAALFGWLALAPVAQAGVAELDALVSQAARPTMEQVLQAAGPEVLKENPYAHVDVSAYDSKYRIRTQEMNLLPQAIAFMERAFPGAVWAPLGRDAVIFGDALDAFYLSIGQPGRVHRLNASGASFAGYEAEELDQMRVKLLESAGLDFKTILVGRPFVGIDSTNFYNHSQSTNLMRAAYEAYAKRGGNTADLLRHLNFLGLNRGQTIQGSESEHIENYFAGNPLRGDPAVLSSILDVNVGHWTHALEWHDTFGPLTLLPDGRVEGTPGADFRGPDARKAILADMIEIYRQVSNPEFLASVQTHAQTLGFDLLGSQSDDGAVQERAKLAELSEGLRQKNLQHRAENYGRDREARLQSVVSNLWALKETWLPPSASQSRTSKQNAHALLVALQKESGIRAALAQEVPNTMKAFSPSESLLHALTVATRQRTALRLFKREYSGLLATLLASAPQEHGFIRELNLLCDREPTLRKAIFELPLRGQGARLKTLVSELRTERLLTKVDQACSVVFDFFK